MTVLSNECWGLSHESRDAFVKTKSARIAQHSVLCAALCAMLFALCLSAEAQQPAKVFRVGLLSAATPSNSPARRQAFLRGLRDRGYVEGKNFIVEDRFAAGKITRLNLLAAELVRLKADVIVTAGGISTRAAKEATGTIPIVMTQDIDPVGNGFIASLAHPGGNITGLATLGPEISGKQLELLKEVFSKISRVAVLGTSTNPGTAAALKETELAAAALGLQLQHLDILNPKDIEAGFRTAANGRAEAILVLISSVINSQRKEVVDLALKSRLPAIYPFPEFVEAGGLMSYGVNFTDL